MDVMYVMVLLTDIKNLIFHGGPKAEHDIVSIKDAFTLQSNLDR